MTNDPYKNRHQEQRIIKNTDQTEFAAILKTSAVVDAGIYDDRVSGALDDFRPDGVEINQQWHETDVILDTSTGQITEEIQRRERVMGGAYPFNLNEGQIIYHPSKSGVYEFCLAISTAPNITSGDNVKLPRTFERLSATLVKLYLGCLSESIHVGSPRDEDIGTKFKLAMEKVAERTNEFLWGHDPALGGDPLTTGDEGLDFVVWKEMPDKRAGKFFLIGQCACGNDWDTKLNDLTLNKLSKWFNPICYVEPIRVFVTSHHLSDVNLRVAQYEAGVVFDRARLAAIGEMFSTNEELVQWKLKFDPLSKMIFV